MPFWKFPQNRPHPTTRKAAAISSAIILLLLYSMKKLIGPAGTGERPACSGKSSRQLYFVIES